MTMRPGDDSNQLNRGESLLRIARRDIVDRWEHIVLTQVDPRHRHEMRTLLNVKYEITKGLEQAAFIIEWPVQIAKKESTAKKTESEQAVLQIAKCLAEFCEGIVQGAIQHERKLQAVLCLKLVGLYAMTTVKIWKRRKGAHPALSRSIFCGLRLSKLMTEGWNIDLNDIRGLVPASIWKDLEKTLKSDLVDMWDRAVKKIQDFLVGGYLTHQNDRPAHSKCKPQSRPSSVSRAVDLVACTIDCTYHSPRIPRKPRLSRGDLQYLSRHTLLLAEERKMDLSSNPRLRDVAPVRIPFEDEEMADTPRSGRSPRRTIQPELPSPKKGSRSPRQYSPPRRQNKTEEASPEPYPGLDGQRVSRAPLVLSPRKSAHEALHHVSGSMKLPFDEQIYVHHPQGTYDQTLDQFWPISSPDTSMAPSLASVAMTGMNPSTPSMSSLTSMNTSIASPPPNLLHSSLQIGGNGPYYTEDFEMSTDNRGDVEMLYTGNASPNGVTAQEFHSILLQQQQLRQQHQQQLPHAMGVYSPPTFPIHPFSHHRRIEHSSFRGIHQTQQHHTVFPQPPQQ